MIKLLAPIALALLVGAFYFNPAAAQGNCKANPVMSIETVKKVNPGAYILLRTEDEDQLKTLVDLFNSLTGDPSVSLTMEEVDLAIAYAAPGRWNLVHYFKDNCYVAHAIVNPRFFPPSLKSVAL